MNESSKRALIIGASRGLGLGLTKEFVARRWEVTATARDLSRATSLSEFAKTSPSAVILETVDIDNGEQVSALARRLDKQSFDLVFVSAGVGGCPCRKFVRELIAAGGAAKLSPQHTVRGVDIPPLVGKHRGRCCTFSACSLDCWRRDSNHAFGSRLRF